MAITNTERLEAERRQTERERKPRIHIHDDHRFISIGFVDAEGYPVRGDTLLELPKPYDSPQSDHNVALRWARAVAEMLSR